MRPNESVFLDLWFSPEIRNSLKVESEDEALTYDLETGYLTAPNTPEGSADLVFSNGYPEGDEKRVEAVTHVIWSENPLSDISISNAPQSLPVGSSVQLEAAVTPDDYIGRVSWESSDTSVPGVLSTARSSPLDRRSGDHGEHRRMHHPSVTITVTGEQPGESGPDRCLARPLHTDALRRRRGQTADRDAETRGNRSSNPLDVQQPDRRHRQSDGKVTPLAAGVTVVTAAAGTTAPAAS